MKITRITMWQLTLPLKRPYLLSGGRLGVQQLDSTFVRVDTDEGLSGWGESCPWGHNYLPAHGAGVRSAIELLAPGLIGKDPRALDCINLAMDETLPGHLHAKSPLDIACWDILGQSAALPLWKLLGGCEAARIPVNSSIPTGTASEMIAQIDDARIRGCRFHSAKIGGLDVDCETKRVGEILANMAAGEQVTFDVNRAWTPAAAVAVMNSVDARSWFEQPCETMDQCAHVASRVRQPILLDECLHTFQDHLDAWRLSACEGVKIKPGRLGGLTKARRIRDLCMEVGWQMHIEDVGGSALADTAAIHLAAATSPHFRLASWLGNDHLNVDPVPGQGARNLEGMAKPPEVAGLGVVPDANRLGSPYASFERSR
ncbi:MAG: mandelate racemase/muconate lactonizing enzyme family protein [Rhodobacteraceae bacterium]|nr:mandelate racemase/muconate lactonizing enzyme family protein [Paracoccaceae bacterium]